MDIITIIQIVSAVFLVVLILLQQKGGGLSGAIGGADMGASYSTRRGLEKHIYRLTIIVAIIFFGTAIMHILR